MARSILARGFSEIRPIVTIRITTAAKTDALIEKILDIRIIHKNHASFFLSGDMWGRAVNIIHIKSEVINTV